MKKRIAVIFDSAGTLLHMYRVAKDPVTGHLVDDIESTALVAKKPHQALVILHTDPETIIKQDPRIPLIQFINDNDISIDISCSSSPFTIDMAFNIIKKDNIVIGDLHDVLTCVTDQCPNVFYLAAGIIVDSQNDAVSYVLSTGGRIFQHTPKTVKILDELGVDTYIASGDSMRNLRQLAKCVNIPLENVFEIATTHDKERIVLEMKKKYDTVVMVGDGINDILALRAADVGVMTTQQGDVRPQKLKNAADVVIKNIAEVIDIVGNL
ncbi:MAG TPA: HAD family hydrolase [Methanosarcinaceae archaeon]|nr:HAD family hydrolase [Methanosarcinaceae archaeon]